MKSNNTGFVKFIMLILILVSAAFTIKYFMGKGPSNLTQGEREQIPGNVSNLSLDQKTRYAENYLNIFKKDIDAFFASFQTVQPTPENLQKHMKTYNAIITGYTEKINALELVCPSSSKAASDPQYQSYIRWTQDFQKRDQAVMNDANKRVQSLLRKAGFNRS
ncbi:MAG: hypothetical protein Q8Q33_03945 [Chlamydiota bacterium]|nr:hypothetical protein [Chlamydiota bacterium]